jgi:hypothetical protein
MARLGTTLIYGNLDVSRDVTINGDLIVAGIIDGSITGTAANITGTVSIANGGTGITTYDAGDILYASAANTLSKLAKGTNGQVLKLASGVPTWGTDNNTTYTFETGTINGAFSVTPSGGNAVSVSIYGLGTAAYTASTDYASSSHTHGNITNAGKIGTTANLIVKTTTDGVLTTLAPGTTSQFLRGDGTWATPPDDDTIYEHPEYSLTQSAGTETTLTDITLIDSLTTNSTGHLTGATWRKLVAGSNVTITAASDGNITIDSSFTDTDTLNTAGATNDTGTLYLIGAKTRTANPQTYSNSNVYATDGALYATSLVLSGDLTINGTTTTINSSNLTVDDKNIELGSVSSPNNTTADGGGITLKGEPDKTIIWEDADDSWHYNQNIVIEETTPSITLSNSTTSGKIQYNSTTESIEFIFE